MALFSLSAATDALNDHLDHERQLILSGQIDGLLRASNEKERLLARLPRAVGEATVFEDLRRKAERNQRLLLAAARGLKSAARRVEALNASPAGLRTYGRDGATADLTAARGGIDRQA